MPAWVSAECLQFQRKDCIISQKTQKHCWACFCWCASWVTLRLPTLHHRVTWTVCIIFITANTSSTIRELQEKVCMVSSPRFQYKWGSWLENCKWFIWPPTVPTANWWLWCISGIFKVCVFSERAIWWDSGIFSGCSNGCLSLCTTREAQKWNGF